MRTIRTAVLGASGFSGGELVRLLEGHPSFAVRYLGAASSAGSALGAVHPHLSRMAAAELLPLDPAAIAAETDLVFSALPNGAAAALVPAMLEAGTTVIDLSGDHRLPADDYPAWYGFEHPSPAWLDKAVYGLPELFGDRLRGARLVASPGCFATPVILGCAPLLAAGLIGSSTIHVDGKTGVSGAGRGPSEATSFASTEESIRPYRVPGHQHTPEMERGLELATGRTPRVLFAPHLVPAVRGVVTTCYARLEEGVTTEALTEALAAAYAGRAFVRVLEPGGMVDAKRTRGTNMIELQALADPRSGTAVIVGAIDNLIKGAAGQAIQNANLVHGLDEATALPTTAVYP
ncbi:MAG TPA: N-acetyl-gamma-glutamyl-phosphate reductase [Actinomycetota bacterium]|nr:N-acetyl-gamma-glutamyl-phosphate reductase [Actinomycetota bacterium]